MRRLLWILLLTLASAAGCRSSGTIRIVVQDGSTATVRVEQAADQMAGKTVDVPVDAEVPVSP